MLHPYYTYYTYYTLITSYRLSTTTKQHKT